ncbi:MazG nucleotide pyrophosphohydrolase domain-containing protein [Anaerosinus sp.]
MDIDKEIERCEKLKMEYIDKDCIHIVNYYSGLIDALKALKISTYGPNNERENKLTKLTDVIASKHPETALTIATEECAELIQAITKLKRGSAKNTDNLAEEIADVLICIDWVKRIYGVSELNVNHWIDYKISRCNERFANGTFR